MKLLITFSGNGYAQQYCAACADDNREIRARLEKDLPQVNITDLVFDEVCEECGRRIREIPAHQRLYQLNLRLEIAMTTEIPARSALEARVILDQAIDKEQVGKDIQNTIHEELEKGEVIGEGSCSSHVAEPQVLPPCSNERLVELPQKQHVDTPPMHGPNLFEIRQIHSI